MGDSILGYNGEVCTSVNDFNLFHPYTKSDEALDAKQNICQISNVAGPDQCALYCSNNQKCKGFNYISNVKINDTNNSEYLPYSCQNCKIVDNQCTDNNNEEVKCCTLMGGTEVSSNDVPSGVEGYILDRTKHISSPLKYNTSQMFNYHINPDHIKDVNSADNKPPPEDINNTNVWKYYPNYNKQVQPGIIKGFDYNPVFAKAVSVPSLCMNICNDKADCKGYSYFIPKADISDDLLPRGCVANTPCCVFKTDSIDNPLRVSIKECNPNDTNCVDMNTGNYTHDKNKYSAGYAIKGDKSDLGEDSLTTKIIIYIFMIIICIEVLFLICIKVVPRRKNKETSNKEYEQANKAQI